VNTIYHWRLITVVIGVFIFNCPKARGTSVNQICLQSSYRSAAVILYWERTLHSEKLHIHRDSKLYENTQNWINEIILSFWKNRNSIYHCTKSGKVVRHKETHRTSRRILYYDHFECKSKTFTDSVQVDLLIFHKCKVQTWKQIREMDALYLI
jgi:hypothetical protein